MQQWAPLLKKLPAKIFEKYPDFKPGNASSWELVKKLINLVNHHRMEIVEATADTTYWVCATSGPKQCLGCALCSHNPIIGECSVCRRRCCRGCLEDATGECWACLGYSSPQEEEAKMTTGSGSGCGSGANTALYERRPRAEDDEGPARGGPGSACGGPPMHIQSLNAYLHI